MIITKSIHRIFFIFFFGIVSFISSYAQLGTVEYIDTSGCAGNIPDALFFTRDMAGGGIEQKLFYLNDTTVANTYEWNLGNGDTPTGYINITAPYTADSYYTVSLTESNAAGNCIVKRTRILKLLFDFPPTQLPDKVIYAYLETGCRTLTTSFNYVPLLFNDQPTLEWHFGDGTTYTGFNPTHTYDTVGIYSPYAVYAPGDTMRLYKTAIKVTEPPNAHFTFLQKQDTSVIRGSFETYFIGTQQFYSDTLYRFVWNPLGDSSDLFNYNYIRANASGIPSTDYLYPDSGNYNPSLFVYYNYGVNNEACGTSFDTIIHITDDLANQYIVPNTVFLSKTDKSLKYNHFGVASNGKTTITLKVYSRAGTLVFEKTSVNIDWDCKTAHGTLLKSGIYYYTLSDDSGNSLLPSDKPTGYFQVFRSDE